MSNPKFFGTQVWLDILAKAFHANNRLLDMRCALTTFGLGLVRVGYVNFPIGIRDAGELQTVADFVSSRGRNTTQVDLLRFSAPRQLIGDRYSAGSTELPETCIQDLRNWTLDQLPGSLHYELRRCMREGLSVRRAQQKDARAIFDLYRRTVRHHAGKLRYNLAYFDALLLCSRDSDSINMLVAEARDGTACGFMVTVRDGKSTYYLHGGMDRRFASSRPGYLLMSTAISEAREMGSSTFNLMTSPPTQPALVKYKEKWGGVTYPLVSAEICMTWRGRHIQNALKAIDWLRSGGSRSNESTE